MWLLYAIGVARASVLLGVAWSPVGTGALAWEDAGQFSGTLAGEFDGLLRPPLTAYGGWIGRHDAAALGVAVTRFTNSDYAANTGRSSLGSVRFSADYRRYVWARLAGHVNGYGTGGLYYILPGANDENDGYTPEEQDAADEGSAALRARIGGFGGQAGIGAEYTFGDASGRPAVALGFRYVARVYRGQSLTDEGYTSSTVLLSEAALVFELSR